MKKLLQYGLLIGSTFLPMNESHAFNPENLAVFNLGNIDENGITIDSEIGSKENYNLNLSASLRMLHLEDYPLVGLGFSAKRDGRVGVGLRVAYYPDYLELLRDDNGISGKNRVMIDLDAILNLAKVSKRDLGFLIGAQSINNEKSSVKVGISLSN